MDYASLLLNSDEQLDLPHSFCQAHIALWCVTERILTWIHPPGKKIPVTEFTPAEQNWRYVPVPASPDISILPVEDFNDPHPPSMPHMKQHTSILGGLVILH